MPGSALPFFGRPRPDYAATIAASTPAVYAAASETPPPAPVQIAQKAAKSMSRLAGVDGLRAAAAMWVVLFHIRVFSGARLPIQPLDFFVRSGSTGVCLYLPFAAGRQGRFKTGTFFIRRARRLLPAYYVSLLFALALNVIGGAYLGF